MQSPAIPPSTERREGVVIETDVNLKPYNTFGLPATARRLVRIREELDVRRVVDHPELGRAPKFVLGGGSNLVLTRDVDAVVLKMEIPGLRVEERDDCWIVEAGAGVAWHEAVAGSLALGVPGLENLALIPGTVGAAPVQNIGAYGVELKDRLENVDVVDLTTGRRVTLPAEVCRFGYRDSVFKQTGYGGLAGKSVITKVRLRCPKPWQPQLGYLDIERKMTETGIAAPDARQVFDWICEIRRAKLPDPARIGNAGSFFKNPLVPESLAVSLKREHVAMPAWTADDGYSKLSAAWLVEACGFKGAREGDAGISSQHALVLVNHGHATGAALRALAERVQAGVRERFGVELQPEPLVV